MARIKSWRFKLTNHLRKCLLLQSSQFKFKNHICSLGPHWKFFNPCGCQGQVNLQLAIMEPYPWIFKILKLDNYDDTTHLRKIKPSLSLWLKTTRHTGFVAQWFSFCEINWLYEHKRILLGWQQIFTEVHFLGNLKNVSKSPENKCNSIAQKPLNNV
jgi:hypothetical protein